MPMINAETIYSTIRSTATGKNRGPVGGLFIVGLSTARCPRLVAILGGTGSRPVQGAPGEIVLIFVDDLAVEHPDLEEEDVRQALVYAAAIAEDELHPLPAVK